MKKFTFFLGIVIAFALNVSAQQYVSTSPANRNVILEEFTGRNCGYCPDGHVIANQIAANNPGRFWAINVHAGGFSPTSYPNLNTTDGTTICSNGFNCTSFPGGVVNRSTASSIGRGQWTSTANQQLAQQAEVNVAGVYSLNQSTRTVTFTVEVYYTGSSTSNTNYLTVAMLQDSIMGSQSGMSSNPAQIINGQYCHMHILRDIITPTWGDPITPTTQGTLITRTYSYDIPETIGSPNGVVVDLNNINFLAWVSEQYQGTPTRPILNACKLSNGNPTPCVVFQSCTPTEVEAGINTNLNVTMRNGGDAPTSGNTSVTITSSDPYLTIVNGTASFPQMAQGASQTVNNAFTVRASESMPNNHTININVAATNNGTTWNSTFSLTGIVPCNAPTNLTAEPDGNSVILNWTASPTATSYRVFRGATQIANNITGTTYTNANLAYNHLYCYTVKSNCSNGETSDASNEACATTEEESCDAPTNLTATVNGLSIALSWTASPSATSYKVYRDGAFLANANSTSYTDNNLDYETEYCYDVTAVCPIGESEHSNEACGTTGEIPFMPRDFNVEYIYTEEGNFGALLTWEVDRRGFESYNVYRSTNGVNFTKIATITEINAHNEYFDDVEIGDYYYELTVSYSLNGTTHESEPTEAVHVEITGIDEVAAISNIYPNPATDKLTVKAVTEIKDLYIYTLTGAVVYSASNCGTETEINLSDFAEGVYFIKVTTNSSSETRRFVKEM